jgi:hypothetical protein
MNCQNRQNPLRGVGFGGFGGFGSSFLEGDLFFWGRWMREDCLGQANRKSTHTFTLASHACGV